MDPGGALRLSVLRAAADSDPQVDPHSSCDGLELRCEAGRAGVRKGLPRGSLLASNVTCTLTLKAIENVRGELRRSRQALIL